MFSAIYHFFYRQIFFKKMNSPLGIFLFSVFSLMLSYVIVVGSYKFGPLLTGVLLEGILFLICMISPLTGFYVTAFLSLFIFFPERLFGTYLPLSVAIEFLILGIYIGMLIQGRRFPGENMPFYRMPSSISMLVFLVFILIEAFNPNMKSLIGWLFYLRRYIEFLIIYYLGYKLLDNPAKIQYFIRFWILLGLFNALYTCKQQWFGLFPFEQRWLRDDQHLYALYFQGGTFRKFGFLSDPAANGIWMASMAVFCLILALGEKIKGWRRFLYGCALVMWLATQYTGTRTATLVALGGGFFYALMTLNQRRTLYFLLVGTIVFLFMLFGPIDNSTINRFRSSFRGKTEESMLIRDINRHSIQPYIFEHPMGGGLATSSSEGLAYNPGHRLAGFPPDSGFLKLAIETGWIGYAIALIYYFILICQGVHGYFRASDPQIRLYILAITGAILIFVLAQYSQVSIGQFPGIFFFYPSAALVIRLLVMDREQKANENHHNNLTA